MVYFRDDVGEELYYNIILLINTMIRLCNGDTKIKYIKEMNLKQNKEYIFRKIIVGNNLDADMEHQLYVLQTYIFR